MRRNNDAVTIWDVVLLSERVYNEMSELGILPPNAVYYRVDSDDEITVHSFDMKIKDETIATRTDRPMQRYKDWHSELIQRKEKVGYFIT